jgi:hypothetical protein
MVIAFHNTDNGDGWEREQEFQYLFETFRKNEPTRWASISSFTR